MKIQMLELKLKSKYIELLLLNRYVFNIFDNYILSEACRYNSESISLVSFALEFNPITY